MAHPVRAVRSPWFRDRRGRCYSKSIWTRITPAGQPAAARRLGRDRYTNLVAFSSLSKRSERARHAFGEAAHETDYFLLCESFSEQS